MLPDGEKVDASGLPHRRMSMSAWVARMAGTPVALCGSIG